MSRKRYTPEQIIGLRREVEDHLIGFPLITSGAAFVFRG